MITNKFELFDKADTAKRQQQVETIKYFEEVK